MSIHNRAQVVDENFVRRVKEGDLPAGESYCNLADAGLTKAALVDLFESQILSRRLDLIARELRSRGATYYTIGSAGHEGNAALGKAFRVEDFAFLHYRSGAFFIARAKQSPGETPVYDMMLSLAASADDPIAAGRHKVFGSLSLNIPPQTSTIASHLPKAVGMAWSQTRARRLNLQQATMPRDGVVLCSFGDASFNHATAQTALNLSSYLAYKGEELPLVWICEDNGIGISVPTPSGWVKERMANMPGLAYLQCDGRDLIGCYVAGSAAAHLARDLRRPVFLHMQTVRLLGHAGSDVEALYRSLSAIEATEADDPLLHSARQVIEHAGLSGADILQLYESVRRRVARVGEEAILRPKLTTPAEVMASVIPPRDTLPARPVLEKNAREELFANDARFMDRPQHMAKLLNWGIAELAAQYSNLVLFGEDIANKGGVYHVTSGLSQKFGADRVFDTLLDETSILGAAIGHAQNGFLPMPEIQFLAYVHNAEDQLRGEASTLSFFSNGQFVNPMVVRIAGLAYQKGFGGHFHNDNSLTVLRDLPGVIVAVPSRGDDAVKMLRGAVEAAHRHGRVVVFVEPIALYMTKDLHEEGDGRYLFSYPSSNEIIRPGEFGLHGTGGDLAIVTYGNGTFYSLQAQKILAEQHGIETTVVDLRWLAPLDDQALCEVLKNFQKVLVVEECRRTGSFSEQLITSFCEKLSPLPQIRRVSAYDCFIPLGQASTVLLPETPAIVAEALTFATSLSQRKKAKRKAVTSAIPGRA